MNKNIDLANLLKDCPKGMELDCTMYENVTFVEVCKDTNTLYPIYCITTDENGNRSGCSFTKNGYASPRNSSKCVIFPKGKTTWEGFHIPFVDGDVVMWGEDEFAIFKEYIKHPENDDLIRYHVYYNAINDDLDTDSGQCCMQRLATEEEKRELFDAIKSHGYKWNADEKKLEKLIEPKFKVGDTIRAKNGLQTYKITNVTSEYYSWKIQGHACVGLLPVKDQDDWILIPNRLITEYKIYYTRDSTGEDHHLTFSTQEAMEGCLECMRQTNKDSTTYTNIVCKKETVETLDL